MTRFIDLTNQRFGKYVVIKLHCMATGNKPTMWIVRCDCGNIRHASTSNLRGGKATRCKSCTNITHGMYNTPEYGIWGAMKNRCNNPRSKEYYLYGGRGIKVCTRWNKSFQSFYNDMGKRPHPKLSIDRIDNNGHYSPENCRWITRDIQNSNKRNNVNITINGVTKTVTQWAKVSGVNQKTIRNRLNRGIPDVKAIFTPPHKLKTL